MRYPARGSPIGSAISNPPTHRRSNLDRTSTRVPQSTDPKSFAELMTPPIWTAWDDHDATRTRHDQATIGVALARRALGENPLSIGRVRTF